MWNLAFALPPPTIATQSAKDSINNFLGHEQASKRFPAGRPSPRFGSINFPNDPISSTTVADNDTDYVKNLLTQNEFAGCTIEYQMVFDIEEVETEEQECEIIVE